MILYDSFFVYIPHPICPLLNTQQTNFNGQFYVLVPRFLTRYSLFPSFLESRLSSHQVACHPIPDFGGKTIARGSSHNLTFTIVPTIKEVFLRSRMEILKRRVKRVINI